MTKEKQKYLPRLTERKLNDALSKGLVKKIKEGKLIKIRGEDFLGKNDLERGELFEKEVSREAPRWANSYLPCQAKEKLVQLEGRIYPPRAGIVFGSYEEKREPHLSPIYHYVIINYIKLSED